VLLIACDDVTARLKAREDKMSKEGWMGLRICVVMVLVLVGCGVLYGPLIGPNPEHCANNPGICTEAQQCNTKTGFCVDAINDMTQRAPAVASVSPKAGRNNVATTITIMGSNFHESPVVTVGGVACGAVVRDSENKITCQVEPRPGTCGPQDILTDPLKFSRRDIGYSRARSFEVLAC
jgi:hypothetical protein